MLVIHSGGLPSRFIIHSEPSSCVTQSLSYILSYMLFIGIIPLVGAGARAAPVRRYHHYCYPLCVYIVFVYITIIAIPCVYIVFCVYHYCYPLCVYIVFF